MTDVLDRLTAALARPLHDRARAGVTSDDARFIMIRNFPFQTEGGNPVPMLNFFGALKAEVGR